MFISDEGVRYPTGNMNQGNPLDHHGPTNGTYTGPCETDFRVPFPKNSLQGLFKVHIDFLRYLWIMDKLKCTAWFKTLKAQVLFFSEFYNIYNFCFFNSPFNTDTPTHTDKCVNDCGGCVQQVVFFSSVLSLVQLQ